MFFKGLTWTIVISLVLSVLAVFINREKVESGLISRSFAGLSEFNKSWVKLKIEGRDLSFSGESPLMALRQSALEAVRAVKGVRNVADSSTAKPKAVPYQWSATRTETGIVLKGHVPSPELRADILEKAKLVSDGAAINDQMELADGAPEEDWSSAIEFGLIHMDKLKTGSISIDENAVRIEGEAKDVKSYMALTEAFQGGGDAPDGYILASNVSTPKVADFLWSARRNDNGIVLEGYAPSAESREEIEAMVVDVANGASIDNRLKLASGEPADWDDRITYVIDHLRALKSGDVQISNAGIAISGEAASNAEYDTLQKLNAPAGVSVTKVISRPIAAPFIWSASLDQNTIVLDGKVPGEVARKAMLEKAVTVADGRKIVDNMDFAGGAPAGWEKFTGFALDNLVQMKSGEVKLTDSDLAIKGTARDEAALAALNSANAPEGGKLSLDVMAPSKPEPGPAETEAAKAAEEAKAAEAAKAVTPKADDATIVTLDVCQSLLNSIFELKHINFKTDSADLKDASQGTIDIVASTMNRCPEARIEIGGHTDSDGDDQMNLALSEKRAQSVMAALVKLGIGENRLTAVGYGETKPVDSNGTPEDKAHNRRIEFLIKQ